MVLSDEDIAFISNPPKREFVNDDTARLIMERVKQENGGLIDRITLETNRAWSVVANQVIGAEVIPQKEL